MALYHRNNLLQSFVLTAAVAEGEDRPWRTEAQVEVRLTFSSTARFGNLDQLGKRLFSVAMNQDAQGGTHTLMFKKDNVSQPVYVTEDAVNRIMTEFRDLLENASAVKKSGSGSLAPRFPLDPAIGTKRPGEFEGCLRELARLGGEIWRKLFQDADPKTRRALAAVLKASDQPIQFIRHGRNLPFPWQIVYDYPLPEGNAFVNAKVCLALSRANQEMSTLARGCPHFPGEDVICIEGFWGVRHRIEQLTDKLRLNAGAAARQPAAVPSQEDLRTKIRLPQGNPLVCLGVGLENDLAAQALATRLGKQLGTGLRLLGHTDDLLTDVLWKDNLRPALLVVLGHLEPADRQRNQPARILPVVLPAGYSVDRALSDTKIINAACALAEWTSEPRPLVLLMACGSAKTALADLTTFIDTFLGIGAAGIIGTENTVFSDLAAHFAEEVVLGLSRPGTTLGAAVRSFTAGLLRRGNPLPFSFSVFGSADLRIERMDNP